MSQCLHVAETMFNSPMPPPPVFSPQKRKSAGDLPDYASAKRQAIASPGEVSPRGFPLGPNIQSAPGAQPVNIQPRPNGYAQSAPALTPPSVSASPYNPAPTGRRRGRPPKSVQSTWQVSTYPPIAPSTTAPNPTSQPHSPGVHVHPAHQPPFPGLPDPKSRKKALPEIAPRPAQGMSGVDPAAKSPAVPGAEYQNWREETSRREYYQVQAADAPSRERPPASTYPPILPRPRSPLPPPRDLARPASTEPRPFTATPPTNPSEPVKTESQATAAETIRT